ncbi:hypothetical protein HD806DRAFT_526893 [Xylariaceae sp. AK1471]|nr:hypothetical protein HD806DRAFT_526893 [Xylariaceae sp. AK1471]
MPFVRRSLMMDGIRDRSQGTTLWMVEGNIGEEAAEKDVRCLRMRMVEIGFENQTLGSAASALATDLMIAQEPRGKKLRMTQGVDMGCRSMVTVKTTVAECER